MKRAFAVFLALIIFSAHRCPAPITEQTPSPPPAASPSEPAQTKYKPRHAAESGSASRFDGTWRVTSFRKAPNGNTFNRSQMLIIRNGTAEYVEELTSTLSAGKKWSDFSPPYNAMSPIHKKWTKASSDLRSEGSNLKINWPGQRLVAWDPKTIPISAFKNPVGQPSTVLLILSGDHLIDTNGKQSQTYARIR